MVPPFPLHGLVAAVHTPFAADGSLFLDAVPAQADHLVKNGVIAAFVGGTTGESSSLSLAVRLSLTHAWSAATRGTPLRLIVHVGSNCLADARTLAADAEAHGAAAISALAPSYFKPRTLDALLACCADVAAAAPATPFYYYDIPALTGVSFPMADFLARAADAVPTLAGLKFTNPDLMSYLQCLRAGGGRWDIPWGVDEWLLGALALGARGAVGSTYNFAAPISHEIMSAFSRGDLETARAAQQRSVDLIALLSRHGYMAAAKATMTMLGIPVGPPRLPHLPLTPAETDFLRHALESQNFFAHVQK